MIGDTAAAFGVNWTHLISQIISFSIVAFMLYKWAYKPILKLLEQRRQQIDANQAEAVALIVNQLGQFPVDNRVDHEAIATERFVQGFIHLVLGPNIVDAFQSRRPITELR